MYLSEEYSTANINYNGIAPQDLKPFDQLTNDQKMQVTKGIYRALPVHPTQIYSTLTALTCALILYLYRKRNLNAELKNRKKILIKPGSTFAAMLIIYGIARFLLEFLRDDNPYEYDSITISQYISIAMIIFGTIFMIILQYLKTDKINPDILTNNNSSEK